MGKFYMKIFYSFFFIFIVLNFSYLGKISANIDIYSLSNFSNFVLISNCENIVSTNSSTNIGLSLYDNTTLDINNNELYRLNLDRNYYDFDLTVTYEFTREQPSDFAFRISLESNYDENGNLLDYYNKICSILFIAKGNDFRDAVYRIEFFPFTSYQKYQSPVSYIDHDRIKVNFSRISGIMECLVSEYIGYYNKYCDLISDKCELGVNRTINSISLEIILYSENCNSFYFDVNSISGNFYNYLRSGDDNLPYSIALFLPNIISVIPILVLFVLSGKIMKNQKYSRCELSKEII